MNIPPNDQKVLDQIICCAYLAAVGDKILSPEEANDISGMIQGVLRGTYLQREAIEHYEKTHDYKAALLLKKPVEDDIIDVYPGLPPFLKDVYEERKVLKSDELLAFEKLEASKIVDPFFQRLAIQICHFVCSSDKEVSEGEEVSIRNMSSVWGIGYFEHLVSWMQMANAIILEEEIEEGRKDMLMKMSLVAKIFDAQLYAKISGKENPDDAKLMKEALSVVPAAEITDILSIFMDEGFVNNFV